MNTPKRIRSKAEYNNVMAKLEKIMLKGSENLNDQDFEEVRKLSILVQEYEQHNYKVEPPTTLAGMLEWKMYQRKLRQTELAQILHISTAKLSLIMNGKQKPDVAFLKAVHRELDVDADFLLEHA